MGGESGEIEMADGTRRSLDLARLSTGTERGAGSTARSASSRSSWRARSTLGRTRVRIRGSTSRGRAGGFAVPHALPGAGQGPCMRCLGGRRRSTTEIDAREVDQDAAPRTRSCAAPTWSRTPRRSGRWAHDAAVLAMPDAVPLPARLRRLCPICGASLNDADPATHEHEAARDPRWAKLRELKLD